MNNLNVETTKTSHGRRYNKRFTLNPSDYGAPATSWLGNVLSAMSERSTVQPLPTSDIDLFQKVLWKIKDHISCRKIYKQRPSVITRKEMHSLFAHVEECIETSFEWTPAVKSRASMYFRRWMIRFIDEGAFGESLSRHPITFKTRLTGRFPARATLSENALGEDPPIDALPHSNIRDLKQKIMKRLDADASRLIQVCVAELEFWMEVRQQLSQLGRQTYSEEELEAARCYLVNGVGRQKDFNRIASLDPKRLAGAISNLCQDRPRAISGSAKTGPTRSRISLSMMKALGLPAEHIEHVPHSQILQMPLRAHYHELSAAFLLLLLHTSWNAHSLRTMSVDCIKQVQNGYFIQGFKQKTGQHTPDVFIDASHKGGISALELIIWNNLQLRAVGIITPDDKNCWYAWPKNVKPDFQTDAMGDLDRAKQVLIKKYKLRPFSLDQIRTHMLVRVAMKHGTPEAARVSAGHSNISTTGHYLDQFLLTILSKSINLEFQRRLEARILKDTRTPGASKHFPVSHASDDRSLFKPIGDGTLCSNPHNPPDLNWLVGNQCDAKHCHHGNGCKNNRIEITRPRIEEIVRLNIYYRGNWKRIYEENPEAFEKCHGPVMLFNFALLEYLRRSLFRTEIQEVIERLAIGGLI